MIARGIEEGATIAAGRPRHPAGPPERPALRGSEPLEPSRRRDGDTGARSVASGFEAAALWTLLIPLLLVMRPYAGIVRDARIYIGRGMADRDPAGIGRDLMFAFDEQTGFSILRHVVRALLDVMTAPQASMALVIVGSAMWLAAACSLVLALARGRAAWAAIACILVLPAGYGGFGAFVYAEAVATPRIFAEAAVLGGLAALAHRRNAAAALLLGSAVLLHPLMAMAGLAVAGIVLIAERPRRLVPVGLGAAGLLLAVLVGLPGMRDLFTPLDPDWMSVLRPSRYLFPSQWPDQSYGHIVRQMLAVAIAGAFLPNRGRSIVWGTAAAAALGVGLSLVLGDWLPTRLVTQLQPWRATWLLAVIGHASLALAAVKLWPGGPVARLILALLLLTWLAADGTVPALLLGGATLALFAASRRGLVRTVPARAVILVAAAAAFLALVKTALAASLLLDLVRAGGSAGIQTPWHLALTLQAHGSALMAAILAVAVLAPPVWRLPGRITAALALSGTIAGAVFLWDSREPAQHTLDAPPDVAALRSFLAASPGEIFWLGGDIEAWFLAGRPAFASVLQRGPALFSRPLAVAWKSRMDTLSAIGLVRPGDIETWDSAQHLSDEVILATPVVEAFCRDHGRPAGLVAPGDQRAAVPAERRARLWHPPAPVQNLTMKDGSFHWRLTEVYTVIACTGPA